LKSLIKAISGISLITSLALSKDIDYYSQLRAGYITLDNKENSDFDTEAFAIGGRIGVKTDITSNFSFNAELYTVQDLGVQNDDLNKVNGDFFDKIPVKANAIIMSRILHDWNDQKATIILNNVRNALCKDGTLFVIENLADKIPDNAALLSINMRIMTNSFERTKNQYSQLLENNNFVVKSYKKLNNLQWIIEAKINNYVS
jgi:hypothetical protein